MVMDAKEQPRECTGTARPACRGLEHERIAHEKDDQRHPQEVRAGQSPTSPSPTSTSGDSFHVIETRLGGVRRKC